MAGTGKPGRPKGSVNSPEVRARISAGMRQAWADPEKHARLSAAATRTCTDPEIRARRSASLKQARADPEARARMSAATKRGWARKAVRQAGLALWGRHVDRARELLDSGKSVDAVVEMLQQEFGKAS